MRAEHTRNLKGAGLPASRGDCEKECRHIGFLISERSKWLAPGRDDLGKEYPSDHDVGDVELRAPPSGSVRLDSAYHGAGRPVAIELDLSKVPKVEGVLRSCGHDVFNRSHQTSDARLSALDLRP